jgi:hypothetical protein
MSPDGTVSVMFFCYFIKDYLKWAELGVKIKNLKTQPPKKNN